jgi:hypothetical protein
MTPDFIGPNARNTAQQLLALEASDVDVLATIRVCEKLRRPLSNLAGATGFHALLSRALTLARAHDPRLGETRVRLDGSLEGFNEPPQTEDGLEGVALIAQLLELLHVFIGEDLTMRLLTDVWPDLPPINAEVDGERENDPTK